MDTCSDWTATGEVLRPRSVTDDKTASGFSFEERCGRVVSDGNWLLFFPLASGGQLFPMPAGSGPAEPLCPDRRRLADVCGDGGSSLRLLTLGTGGQAR